MEVEMGLEAPPLKCVAAAAAAAAAARLPTAAACAPLPPQPARPHAAASHCLGPCAHTDHSWPLQGYV
jgi:hypothetical protein